jgi:hypothetical protein
MSSWGDRATIRELREEIEKLQKLLQLQARKAALAWKILSPEQRMEWAKQVANKTESSSESGTVTGG